MRGLFGLFNLFGLFDFVICDCVDLMFILTNGNLFISVVIPFHAHIHSTIIILLFWSELPHFLTCSCSLHNEYFFHFRVNSLCLTCSCSLHNEYFFHSRVNSLTSSLVPVHSTTCISSILE